MDAIFGFLVILGFVVLTVYPFMGNRSLGSVIEFCIAFIAAIGATILFTYLFGLFDWGFELGLLVSIVGTPAIFIVTLIFMYRGLKSIEEDMGQAAKERRIRHQFATAKQYIEQHQYQLAQTILASIDDPKAREWEAYLRKLTTRDPDFLRQLQ